ERGQPTTNTGCSTWHGQRRPMSEYLTRCLRDATALPLGALPILQNLTVPIEEFIGLTIKPIPLAGFTMRSVSYPPPVFVAKQLGFNRKCHLRSVTPYDEQPCSPVHTLLGDTAHCRCNDWQPARHRLCY